MYSNSNF